MWFRIGIVGMTLWVAIDLWRDPSGPQERSQFRRLLSAEPAVLPSRPHFGLRRAGRWCTRDRLAEGAGTR